MGEVGFFALFIATGFLGGALLLGPIGQAIGRGISGRGRGKDGLTTGEMTAERLGALEARLEELEASQARLLDLEERVEFAERLLTRGSAAEGEGQSEGNRSVESA